jgi:hypothetical protein
LIGAAKAESKENIDSLRKQPIYAALAAKVPDRDRGSKATPGSAAPKEHY